MTHFLQSEPWGRFQIALGRTIIQNQGDGWSYQAILEKGKINKRLYVPYGPVVSGPDALKAALLALTKDAHRNGATFIRVEPTGSISSDEILRQGLRHVSRVQPEATSVVNLSPSVDELIAAMPATNRNLHRTYEKKGLRLWTSDNPADIHILTKLLHGVAAQTGMHAHADTYLETQARTLLPTGDALLYGMSLGDVPVVAALVFDGDDTRYYAHAAADYEHRRLGAGTSIVSHMMLDAKHKGLTSFDLYGIWPHALPPSPQAGITAFKRSFGGRDVLYSGTYELPVRRIPYTAYRLLSSIGRKRA